MRVLFVCSNPTWTSRLDLGDEMRELLNGLQHQAVKLTLLPAAQRLDLKVAITNRDIDVLHFSGHATAEEGIILRDEDGMEDPVAGTELHDLLDKHDRPIRLVVLNACNTNATAEKIRGSVRAVIGTNKELKDDSARRMTRYLYSELSEGKTIEEAYTTARLALREAGLDETAYNDVAGDGAGETLFDKPVEGDQGAETDGAGANGPTIEGKAAYDKYFFIDYLDTQIEQLTRLVDRSRKWFWALFAIGLAFVAWFFTRSDEFTTEVVRFLEMSFLGKDRYQDVVGVYYRKPYLDAMIAVGAAIPVIITFFQNRLSLHGNRELRSLRKLREIAKSSEQLSPELQNRLQKVFDQCIRGADPEYKPFFWDVIFEKLQSQRSKDAGDKEKPGDK